MKNILDDDSIEVSANRVKAKREIVELNQSEGIAYLIKNMGHIKELIKGGEIGNNAESVKDEIRRLTGGNVRIDLNNEVINLLSKNNIHTKEYLDDMKAIKSFCAVFLVLGIFIGIIFTVIVCMSDNEIDFIKTTIFWLVVTLVFTIMVYSD